ncbi:MAG: protein kinase [Geodermatophilaceae bacterium]
MVDAEGVDAERFGPYRIETLLGRGGMGEVYRAYDESHKRTVALKLLSPHLAADEGYRARFRRESELAARLREAHVIPIHRYGEIGGRLFIDMRLVEGSDLAAVLEREGLLPPQRAVAIISQVAKALDAAHADGLIHRDVKPSNVLVSDRGEDSDDDFVYLVDFGIARAAEAEQGLTKTGSALGSFDYMAPERFLEGTIDRRTDVYSLACLLYECLTGNRPFPGDALPVLMYGHLNSAPPLPSRTVGGIPQALDDVLTRGMAKRPDDRFPRAGDLAAAARRAFKTASPVELAPNSTDLGRSAPTNIFNWTGSGTSPQPAGAGTAPTPASRLDPNSGPIAGGPVSNPGLEPFPGSYPQVGPARHSGPPRGPFTGAPYRPTDPPFHRPETGPGYGGKSRSAPGFPGMSKARALLILAVVLTLVAVGSIGALLLAKSDSSSTTASPGPSADESSETGDEPSPPADPVALLRDLIPVDFRAADCQTGETAGDGDLAFVECGASMTRPGPTFSQFLLYDDPDQTRAVFEEDMRDRGVPQNSSLAGCVANAGYGVYTVDAVVAGYYTCRITDGFASMSWTEDDFSFYGYVQLRGGEAELAELFEWWINHSAVPE